MPPHEQGAFVDRQTGEGSIEAVGVGGSVVDGRVVRGRLTDVVRIEQGNLTNLRSASPSELLPAGIHVDSAEPGIEQVRVAQSAAMAPGRDEGLLRGVGGVRRIAQDGE